MNDGYEYIPTKVATEVEVMGSIRQKQGHSCCGCCCDTRRAVIICNVVMICVTVVTVAFMIAGIELVQVAAQTANDDEIKTAGKELSSFPIGLVIAFAILHCVLYGLGIQGGLSFTKWQVMCALASYVLSFILQLVNFNFLGMFVSVLFAYPHVFFIQELDNHIMSPENYPNEVQSCCCV